MHNLLNLIYGDNVDYNPVSVMESRELMENSEGKLSHVSNTLLPILKFYYSLSEEQRLFILKCSFKDCISLRVSPSIIL